MSDVKFCPDCGAQLVTGDRFCGDCGFDTATLAARVSSETMTDKPTAAPPSAAPFNQQPQQQSYQQPQILEPSAGGLGPMPGRNYAPPGTNPGGSKNAMVIMVSVLALLFIAGGGIYWWLSQNQPGGDNGVPRQAVTQQNESQTANAGEQNKPGDPAQQAPQVDLTRAATDLSEPGQSVTQQNESQTANAGEQNKPGDSAQQTTQVDLTRASTDLSEPGQSVTQQNESQTANAGEQNKPGDPAQQAPQVDLTRAATYLSKPGLKFTFFVNYPDGMSGIVDRISGQAVPNEAVRVSEVEVGINMGEEFGYGFHYVERPDGTYYILDNTPYEIFPVLKNNLTVGQTWSYDMESESINYKVVDMGVDLDLGFAKFDDCLLLLEDNQAVVFQSITYYAPGKGSVYVIEPGGAFQYYKLTGMETIDPGQAANTIIKWCPNYQDIKDDRSQSY